MQEYRKGDSVDYLIGGWTAATPNAKVMFCCKCLAKVYIAPSGQRIMRENPACKPLCIECMAKTEGEFSVKAPFQRRHRLRPEWPQLSSRLTT